MRVDDINRLRGRIERVIMEFGSPIIPLTLLFEELGHAGLTGIGWGILAGAICAVAIELGYEVQVMGRRVLLVKKSKRGEKAK
jgi:hypothetical protein